MNITNIHRYLSYEIVAEIDERTYRLTNTGDGVGYAWRYEEARDHLRGMAERALEDVPNSTVDPESIEVAPGYLRARVRVKRPNALSGRPTPKAAMSALSGIGVEWNERGYAQPTPDGNAYLDGLHIGDRYIETVRPSDAPTPEEWITDHCEEPDADAAPDPSDGPVFVIEEGEADAWDPETDRHQPMTAVLPVLPETYDPVESNGKYDDTTVTFEWTSDAVKDFRIHVEDQGTWGGKFRLEVHPHYLKLQTVSGSLLHPPTRFVLRDLERVVRKFNQGRPKVAEEDMGHPIRRPEFQVAEKAYISAASTKGKADEWIEARGLNDVDGTPFEPEPEPEPEPEADDEPGRGLLHRLGGGG